MHGSTGVSRYMVIPLIFCQATDHLGTKHNHVVGHYAPVGRIPHAFAAYEDPSSGQVVVQVVVQEGLPVCWLAVIFTVSLIGVRTIPKAAVKRTRACFCPAKTLQKVGQHLQPALPTREAA